MNKKNLVIFILTFFTSCFILSLLHTNSGIAYQEKGLIIEIERKESKTEKNKKEKKEKEENEGNEGPFSQKQDNQNKQKKQLPGILLPLGKNPSAFIDSPVITFYPLSPDISKDIPLKFVLTSDSNWIWLINIKTQTVMPITEGFSAQSSQSELFYIDWDDMYPQIFKYNPSNFERYQITSTKMFKKNLTISHNKKKLAYIAGKNITDSDIWIYDLETKRHYQITKELWVYSYNWMPDDEKIIFHCERCGIDLDYKKSCIGTINLSDGSVNWLKSTYLSKEENQYININEFFDFTPSISPEGKKIIISSKKGYSFIPIIDTSEEIFEKVYPPMQANNNVFIPFWGRSENIILFFAGKDFWKMDLDSKKTVKIFSNIESISYISPID